MLLPAQIKSNNDKLKSNSVAQQAKFIVPNTFFAGQNVWVLKATGFNRGIGIHVFN